MYIIHELPQVQLHNIFFLDSKKNIILDGKFTKIINSDEFFTTNGIYISVPLNYSCVEKMSNKNLLKFPAVNKLNMKIILELSQIEQSILEYYKHLSNCNKIAVFSLSDNMKNGCVKLYREYFSNNVSKNYVVKISGVWEDQSRIGLTYKFLDATSA